MTTMTNKYFAKFCAVLMAVTVFVSCERKSSVDDDPRTPFVGDYTFVSEGSIVFDDIPAPLNVLPVNESGDMSISLANKDQAVWVIVDKDSSLAYIRDNQLYMEPSTDIMTVGNAEMVFSYSYSGAALKDNKLTIMTYADVTASYQDKTITGKGEVEVVATKKDEGSSELEN